MNISFLDNLKSSKSEKENIQKLVVFLMNQSTIADASLQNSYKDLTSPRFIVELSISFVDFELQC